MNALLAAKTTKRGYELGSRFDEGPPDREPATQLAAMWRQYVRERHAAALDCAGEHLRINAVGLSSVTPDAKLLAARGVDHEHVVAPFNEQVVHVPCFTAGLDRNTSGGLLGAEQTPQRSTSLTVARLIT